MTTDLTQWLLESDEPWTRYRTLVDLLDRPKDDPEVQAARAEMLAHPQVQALTTEAATWPGYALKRHNDAGHPIYKFTTLADFGVRADDPGPVLSHALSEDFGELSRAVEGKVGADDEGGRSESGNRQWTGSLRRISSHIRGDAFCASSKRWR